MASSPTKPVLWQPLPAGDRDTLAKARWEAINIVQWLVRIANSYVAADTPEQRTVLTFRPADAAFVTKSFEENLALEMRLASLEMQFLENGRPAPHILDPEERSPAEVEAWLLVELLHRGIDRTKFSKNLPYQIVGLLSGDAEDHSPGSCREGLAHLAIWYQNAAAIFEAAIRGAGGVRFVCLPRTLDLTCLVGEKQAGFGFSPGTEQDPSPFFYANARAANGSAGARKQTKLDASALLGESDPAAAAVRFIKSAIG